MPMEKLQKLASSIVLGMDVTSIPFIDPHVLCNEGFQMEDLLTAQFAPVFVEGRPFDHLWLERVVGLRYELPRKSFENRGRIDAVREEIVERASHLQQTRRAALFDNLPCNLLNKSLPVRRWDVCLFCNLFAVVTSQPETSMIEGAVKGAYFCA
jgi:hypothetical protein